MAAATINKAFHACCPIFGKSLKYLKYTPNLTLSSSGIVKRNLGNHVIHTFRHYGVQNTPKKHILLPVIFKKWSSSDVSSSIDGEFKDVLSQLLDALSEDASISSKQKYAYMDIVKDVIQKRFDDDIKIDTNEVSPVELYYLGSKLYSLQGVGQDAVALAVPLFKQSALLGYQDGKYTYAQLLLRPSAGNMPNPVEAAKLFYELAQDGHPYSQFALAGMYSTGYGIEQSFEKSIALFEIAAQNGMVQSFNSIGKLYLNGQGVEKDEPKAVEYFMKGAEAGDPHAYLSLGNCYSHGKGVETDFNKSFEYHLKAAMLGNPYALHNVGTHYFLGKGVELDVQKAAEYFRQAADLGHAHSIINLGKMYYEGFGVPMDWSKAKEYFRRVPPENTVEHREAQLSIETIEKQEQQQGKPTVTT